MKLLVVVILAFSVLSIALLLIRLQVPFPLHFHIRSVNCAAISKQGVFQYLNNVLTLLIILQLAKR